MITTNLAANKISTSTINVFNYDYKDYLSFIQNLQGLTHNNRIVFACIGTDRSTGDSLGPLVGTNLKKLGYTVVGTLEEPLHALNLSEQFNYIQHELKPDLLIAVDACLGRMESIGDITLAIGPLKPGTGVKKELPPIGDISLTGIVNLGGFMEVQLLQCTRLNTVMKMANSITNLIWRAIPVNSAFVKSQS